MMEDGIGYEYFVLKWDVTEINRQCVWTTRFRGPRGARGISLVEMSDGGIVMGMTNGTVSLLDGASGQTTRICGDRAIVYVRAVVSLGDDLFAIGFSRSVRIWSAREGQLLQVVQTRTEVKCLSLSPTMLYVAAGCDDGSVKLYRLPHWHQEWSVKVHTSSSNTVSWSPNGQFLVSGSFDQTVKILCAYTGTILRCLSGHTRGVTSVAFSQDGTDILSSSSDCTVRVERLYFKIQFASMVHGSSEAVKFLFGRCKRQFV